MSKVVAGVLGIFALAACAGQASTTSRLAESMAAVRGAETAGAAQVPQAALHLKLAQEEISAAQKLAGDDGQRSDSLAQRAFADAELALALTREAQARQTTDGYAEAHPKSVSEGSAPSSTMSPTNPGTVTP